MSVRATSDRTVRRWRKRRQATKAPPSPEMLTEAARKIAEEMTRTGAKPGKLLDVLKDSEVDANRKIYCAHYAGCLRAAEWLGWMSFTCSGCPVSEEIPFEQRRAEAADIFRALRNALAVA